MEINPAPRFLESENEGGNRPDLLSTVDLMIKFWKIKYWYVINLNYSIIIINGFLFFIM